MKPNISSWWVSIEEGTPVGTVISRTYNYGGPATTVSVRNKSGVSRSFVAREEAGQILLVTNGPMVFGATSTVTVTANNPEGSSQSSVTIEVRKAVTQTVSTTGSSPSVGGASGAGSSIVPVPPTSDRTITRPIIAPRSAKIRLMGRGGSRIFTGAQVMPRGFWPAGQVGCLRTLSPTRAGLPAGSLLRTQIDINHAHADGSARILLLATEAVLDVGEVVYAVLEPGAVHPNPGTPIQWASMAAAHSIRADIPGSSLDGLGVEPGYWRNGPLVVERRSQNNRAGGSRRIVMDVRFASDGTASVDTQFAVDVCLDTNEGGWDGEATLHLDGFSWTSGVQHHPTFTRLRGKLSNKPPTHVMFPDVSLMIDAGCFQTLDLRLGVPASTITTLLNAAAPGRGQIYHPLFVCQYMPTSGGRWDIGQIPAWSAAWLLSGGSIEMHDLCDDLVGVGFNIPIHYWDRFTNTPLMMTGIRADRWPNGRDDLFFPGWEGAALSHGWTPDISHMPAMGYVSFLMTGDRSALDLVQSEGAYALACQWPDGTRKVAAEGLGVICRQQTRGAAWAMRALGNAWFCSPENGPAANEMKSYFDRAVNANLAWLNDARVRWSTMFGSWAGFVSETEYGAYGGLPPWQQDHFHGPIVRMWLWGFDAAGPWLTWVTDGWLGHRCEPHGNWIAQDGVADLNPWLTSTGAPVTSWDVAAAEMAARDWSNLGVWRRVDGDYAWLGAATFVDLYQCFPGRAELLSQWRFLCNGAPFVNAAYAGSEPQSSVVPRGMTRA